MMSTKRYFKNPIDHLQTVNAHDELLASLTRINTYNPPVQTCSTGWTFQGLYVGPTSIAYLFYRLSQIYPDLEFKDQSLHEWAEAYLMLGEHVHKRAPSARNCGIANETLAHLTLKSVILQDQSLANQLCSYENEINSSTNDGSNEWLYGRAGYLYYLRLCKTVFTSNEHSNVSRVLEKTIEKTVSRILSVPQPWIWHGKQYLGAAHGTIGIICQVVLSKPDTAPHLQPLLSDLLDVQYSSGNFPSSMPSGSDRLVQFCHGGPGFVLSLRSLTPYFPEAQDKISSAISQAQADIWQRGLLTKEPSLCHGIAGNALALDDQQQFDHFLSFMSTESMDQVGWLRNAGSSDEFASLYTGEAGRAWTWAVADQKLAKTCIGYNDV